MFSKMSLVFGNCPNIQQIGAKKQGNRDCYSGQENKSGGTD